MHVEQQELAEYWFAHELSERGDDDCLDAALAEGGEGLVVLRPGARSSICLVSSQHRVDHGMVASATLLRVLLNKSLAAGKLSTMPGAGLQSLVAVGYSSFCSERGAKVARVITSRRTTPRRWEPAAWRRG